MTSLNPQETIDSIANRQSLALQLQSTLQTTLAAQRTAIVKQMQIRQSLQQSIESAINQIKELSHHIVATQNIFNESLQSEIAVQNKLQDTSTTQGQQRYWRGFSCSICLQDIMHYRSLKERRQERKKETNSQLERRREEIRKVKIKISLMEMELHEMINSNRKRN